MTATGTGPENNQKANPGYWIRLEALSGSTSRAGGSPPFVLGVNGATHSHLTSNSYSKWILNPTSGGVIFVPHLLCAGLSPQRGGHSNQRSIQLKAIRSDSCHCSVPWNCLIDTKYTITLSANAPLVMKLAEEITLDEVQNQ